MLTDHEWLRAIDDGYEDENELFYEGGDLSNNEPQRKKMKIEKGVEGSGGEKKRGRKKRIIIEKDAESDEDGNGKHSTG